MKRLIAISTALAALAACTTTPATQSAAVDTTKSPYESEILATVDRFLLALGNHDDAALDEVTITEGVSWIQAIKPGDQRPVQPYTNESLLQPDPDADPFMERYWDPVVRVRGGLAQVWAPYELRDNGKVVHCGIDAFDVVFLDGTWRIASVLSTMEPEACGTMMPASPADMRPRNGWKEAPND